MGGEFVQLKKRKKVHEREHIEDGMCVIISQHTENCFDGEAAGYIIFLTLAKVRWMKSTVLRLCLDCTKEETTCQTAPQRCPITIFSQQKEGSIYDFPQVNPIDRKSVV